MAITHRSLSGRRPSLPRATRKTDPPARSVMKAESPALTRSLRYLTQIRPSPSTHSVVGKALPEQYSVGLRAARRATMTLRQTRHAAS